MERSYNIKEHARECRTIDTAKKCKQYKKDQLSFSDNRVNNTEKKVLQAATSTGYNIPNCRHGNSNITWIFHIREPMTQGQKNQAKTNSGYTGGIQTNAWQVCNHCVPYAMIANQIKNQLQNNSVFAARTYLNNCTAAILGAGQVMPNTQKASWFFEQDINTTINDAIANIANDPRNLFYWPDHTGDGNGTQVDYPRGHGPHGGTIPVATLRNALIVHENLLNTNL